MTQIHLDYKFDQKILYLFPKGEWTRKSYDLFAQFLKEIPVAPFPSGIVLDFLDLRSLDSAGLSQLKLFLMSCQLSSEQLEFKNVPPTMSWILDTLTLKYEPKQMLKTKRPFRRFFEDLGYQTCSLYDEVHEMMSYSGLFYLKILQTFYKFKYFRLKTFINQIKYMGIDALPIVLLLSFLIGIVLAYQGITQFQKFGAEIYVVNLLGVSILREIGVLMTSIIMAGRTGSSITAQIGSMKINREIDAMRVIGVDPLHILVVPRVAALIVALPILTFFADLIGLFGGAVMCRFTMGLSFEHFLSQLQSAVEAKTFFVGLVKAPFFAFVIALIGTFQGFKVHQSAQSLGKMTTRSVVQSIFMIIVLDALFSILFSIYKI